MVKIILLLLFLIIILLIIAIFSINVNIVISFHASTKYKNLYTYNISICGFNFTPNKKKKQNKKNKINLKSILKYKNFVDIDNVSITGEISLGRADYTAVASGIFYSFSGILISFLQNVGSIINIKNLYMTPIYNTEIHADLFFECILKFNLGDIIIENIKNRKD